MMGEVLIIHAADARALACSAAAQLAADGYSVRRQEAGEPSGDDASADAVVVIWSRQLLEEDAQIETARRALSRRVLAPIVIDGAQPPPAFAHFWPIDLTGWDGDSDDPRWQFVRDEIELARLRRQAVSQPASTPSRPRAKARAETTRRSSRNGQSQAIFVRMIPPAAAGLAVLSATAVLMATPEAPHPAPSPDETAEDLGSGERTSPRQAAATARGLRDSEPALRSVLAAPDDQPPEADAAPVETVDLVAALLEENARTEDEAGPRQDGPEASDSAGSVDEAASENAVDKRVAEAGEAPSPAPPAETVRAQGADLSVEAPPPDAESEQMAAERSEQAPEPLPLPPPAPDDYAGIVFRDCLDCPDMVEIPAGSFRMGAGPDEAGAGASEGPVRAVTITRPFALSRREITFDEWRVCADEGGCRAYAPPDAGWGRGERPVINVSFEDAQSYVAWLSRKTGRHYRLPSEAEWEYAARAGRSVAYSNAGVLSPMRANYEDAAREMTAPAGSFAPSAFGLYDMLGNVWEWVADCWRDSHVAAPADGAPVGGDCETGVLKGGAYNSSAWRLRPAHRIAKARSAREADNGFRVARDLP